MPLISIQEVQKQKLPAKGNSASRRVAKPDESSGKNPNFPIRTYDTHPNAHFEEGDVVLPLDTDEASITGTIVGHAAEDRVYVDWGRVTSQEDVDDLIKASEWKYTLRSELPHKAKATKKSSRRASWADENYGKMVYTPMNDQALLSTLDQDKVEEGYYSGLNYEIWQDDSPGPNHKHIGEPGKFMILDDGGDAVDGPFTSLDQAKAKLRIHIGDDGRSASHKKGVQASNRVALFGQGWAQRPTWMGGHGSFEQQHQGAAQKGVPNQLRYPAVVQMLTQAGMNPRVLDQLAGSLDKMQAQTHAQNQLKLQKQNEALAGGDFSQMGGPNPAALNFGQDTLGGQQINVGPGGMQMPPKQVIPVSPSTQGGNPMQFHQQQMQNHPLYPPGRKPQPQLNFGDQMAKQNNMNQQGWDPGDMRRTMGMAASAIRHAARTRIAGIQELLYQSDALDALGEIAAAYTVRRAADVAAAMHDLYRSSRTRKASRTTGRDAMKTVCASVLEVTKRLRRLGMEEPATEVERAMVASMTYERLPVMAANAQLAPMALQPPGYKGPKKNNNAQLGDTSTHPMTQQAQPTPAKIDWRIVQSMAGWSLPAKQMMELAQVSKKFPQNQAVYMKKAQALWNQLQGDLV